MRQFFKFRLMHLLWLCALFGVLIVLYSPHFQKRQNAIQTKARVTKFEKSLKDLERAVQTNDLTLAQSALGTDIPAQQLIAGSQFPLLRIAVVRGQIEIVELLLERGADANSSGNHNTWLNSFGPPPRSFFTSGPALCAVIGSEQADEKRIAMIRLLVQYGADPRQTKGESAMDAAVRTQDAVSATLLRELGVPFGPREMAAFNRFDELKAAVDQNPQLINQRFTPVWALGEPTLLGIALSHGHDEMARWLLDAGASIETIEEMEETLLHKAARGGNAEIVDELIKRGLDVNARRYDGDTPLHWAAAKGHLEVVSQLIIAGAKADDRTLFSSALEHPRIVAQLISAGADPSAKDFQGQTVLDAARRYGTPETVRLLEDILQQTKATVGSNPPNATGT